MLRPWLLPASHEDVFLDRYDRLLKLALRLTANERDRAEDLLHTTYVQFAMARPDLEAIRDIDSYLFISLRNTFISRRRRSAAAAASELSVADYDCAEIPLHSATAAERLLVEDQLWIVCTWACERKESFKAASALILRFFHGYYPREIAAILRVSVGGADKFVQTARREARAVITEQPSKQKSETSGHSQSQETDFLARLQNRIFESCRGTCLPKGELRSLYRLRQAEALPCTVLAHLVSCRPCLDHVNQILGLRRLEERHPNDTLGPDHSSGGSRLTSIRRRPRSETVRKAGEKLRRRLEEHRPAELVIAVNGFVAGSQTVQNGYNKQTLCLTPECTVHFVEVHDEQRMHLLLLNVEPPPYGDLCQEVTVTFGADSATARTLTVRLDLTERAPELTLVYHDPGPAPASVPQFSAPGALDHARRHLRWSPSLKPASWWRTVWFSMVLALLTILALLWTQSQSVSAAALLDRIESREARGSLGRAIHRALDVEERDKNRRVVTRRRVQVWTSADRHLRAVRVYDDLGKITEGEWTRPDGSHILYRRGKNPEQVSATVPTSISAAATLDEVARVEPTASSFRALIGDDVRHGRVNELRGSFDITWAAAPPPREGLLRAELHIGKADLNVTEEVLAVGSAGAEREFRATETIREALSSDSIPASIFVPDAELLPEMASTRTGPVSPPEATPKTVSNSVEYGAEVLLSVLDALDRVGALLGEQVQIRRIADGMLAVDAVLDSEARRAEIANSLNEALGTRGVSMHLVTLAEAAQASSTTRRDAPAKVKELVIGSDRGQDQAEIARYVAGRVNDSARAPDETSHFIARAQEQSRQMRRHARALRMIVELLSGNEASSLPQKERNRWADMVRSHAHECHRGAGLLIDLLAPVFPSVSTPGANPTSGPVPPGPFQDVVIQIANDAVQVDEDLLSALSFHADEPHRNALSQAEFWSTLNRIQRAALRVEAELP
jgi:DNA-directed RNA polymerase specialized sigma24 family protein